MFRIADVTALNEEMSLKSIRKDMLASVQAVLYNYFAVGP